MSITHYIFIGIGVLAFAVALLLWNDRAQRRRRERRVAFGRKHGFEPLPEESGPETRFRFLRGIQLYETTLGLRSSFENALSARREHADTLLVDYTFWQPGREKERTYKMDFTLCQFESDRLDLPSFQIRPETLALKVVTFLGYQDIDLDHSPEFSKRFVLRGPNEAAIRDLFTPEVTARLLRMPKKIWIEGCENVLLVTRSDGFIREQKLRLFLRQAESALRLFTR